MMVFKKVPIISGLELLLMQLDIPVIIGNPQHFKNIACRKIFSESSVYYRTPQNYIQLLRRAGGPGIIQSEQPAFMITAQTSKLSVIPLVVYRIWRALTRQINRKNLIINMLSEQVQQFSSFNFQCLKFHFTLKLWKC